MGQHGLGIPVLELRTRAKGGSRPYMCFFDVEPAVALRSKVVDVSAGLGREAPDAVDGVVRVGTENIAASLAEGEGLADELERSGGIRREDDGIALRGVEEVEDGGTCLCGEVRRCLRATVTESIIVI